MIIGSDMNWIVVRICQPDSEYVESINYVTRFASEQEAMDYIRFQEKEYQESFNKRLKYIESYADIIDAEVPQDNQEWLQLLEKYSLDAKRVTRDGFKGFLINQLLHHFRYMNKVDGYNPPSLTTAPDLRILEIKD